MILYEYPPKLDRQTRQAMAIKNLSEQKKLQKNFYISLITGAIIVAIGFISNVLFAKVLLILIGLGNAFAGYLLLKVSALSRDVSCYTRIYEDKMEHCQGYTLSKKHVYVTIYYNDILKSSQNPAGKLVINLKDNYKSEIKYDGKNKAVEKELLNKQITLSFQDMQSKLFLIENLHEQIKYPKVEYNLIEDEEDEDDKWDSLHKHGL